METRTRTRPVQPVAPQEEPEEQIVAGNESELEKLVEQIRAKKGEESIRIASTHPRFNCISTGIFTLDFALMGGFPEGQATMVYGWESSGKTTVMMRVVAAIQKKYPWRKPVYIDAENTFDMDWAAKQGVDTNNLLLSQPISGEEGVDIAAAVIDAWDTSLLIIDSIPAMVPMKVDTTSAEDRTMTELARLMGVLCSKISSSWARERRRNHFVTVIFINQFRSKIGVMYGDPRTLSGGNQVNRYFATTKIELKNKEVLGKDQNDIEVVEMNEHSFKITKAKNGSSIRSGEFQMVVNPDHPLGEGTFLDAATVATYAKKMGFLTGGGGHLVIQDVEQPFRKLAEVEAFLYENPDEMLRLQQRLISAQRVAKGLPPLPPDGYLLDGNAKENLGL